MHFAQDGNDCALALYKHSLQLIPQLEVERDWTKVTEGIQALYAALELVTVPSIEAAVRKRLAQVLQYYTEEYKEILFQYEKANTIYEPIDGFKFDLLDKIATFYLHCQVNFGSAKNVFDHACNLAKVSGNQDWLFYFRYKRIQMELQQGNLQQCLTLCQQLQSEYENRLEFELLLNLIQYCICLELNCNLTQLRVFHTKINQINAEISSQLPIVFFINIYQFILEGNVQEAILERERYANYLIQSRGKSRTLSYPLNLIDTQKEDQSLLFVSISGWLNYFPRSASCQQNMPTLRKRAFFKYQTCSNADKQRFYYDMWIFSSLLSPLTEDNFTELFSVCTKNENRRHFNLLMLRYSIQIDSSLLAFSNESISNCKLFLTHILNGKLDASSKRLASIDTMTMQYLSPLKLFLEGILYLYQREEHKSKYKFYESLKLANGQFQNTALKCLSLIGLGLVYLNSDLVQAHKVLHSSLLLASKLSDSKLVALSKALFNRVGANNANKWN